VEQNLLDYSSVLADELGTFARGLDVDQAAASIVPAFSRLLDRCPIAWRPLTCRATLGFD